MLSWTSIRNSFTSSNPGRTVQTTVDYSSTVEAVAPFSLPDASALTSRQDIWTLISSFPASSKFAANQDAYQQDHLLSCNQCEAVAAIVELAWTAPLHMGYNEKKRNNLRDEVGPYLKA